ncbi:extracellular solute-binding protein [Micrococcales bacterium 31B]|nr:extracellular solute-binding protein [Micrococcales bacterium 31B]
MLNSLSPSLSRRNLLLTLTVAPIAAATLTACGSSGPQAAGAGGATMWALSGKPDEDIVNLSVEDFKKSSGKTIGVTFFQNDAYKTKINTAVGAGEAPTLIYGWGGGTMKSFAQAGKLLDLTEYLTANPDVKDKVFPATLPAGQVDGKQYAYPNKATQPILFFYNKDLFAKAGVEVPKTWQDLMDSIPKFVAQGVAPISLGGASKWTSMMWLEMLMDRIGGPEVFQNIYDGKADGWSDPASLDAVAKVQELIKAGGFIKGFESITADSNADRALLYTGKAAMMLHGPWVFPGIKVDGGNFVKDGKLGWFPFPTVEGGKGDPSNVIGNPSNYWSISADATKEAQDVALAYLKDGVFSDAVVDALIAAGNVPILPGLEDKLKANEDGEFLTYLYSMAQNAKSFQQSWDQALSPAAVDTLLNAIDKVFLQQLTPEQWADTMNATIGK